jgi:hypothetical protein
VTVSGLGRVRGSRRTAAFAAPRPQGTFSVAVLSASYGDPMRAGDTYYGVNNENTCYINTKHPDVRACHAEEYCRGRRCPAALKGTEMTAVLIAVIIVVGLVALVDLVLTYGLIRRVNSIQAQPHSIDHGLVPIAGHRIREFVAKATDNREITEREFEGLETFAVFVMVGCGPCHRVAEELSQMAPPELPLLLFIASSQGKDDEAARIAAQVPFAAAVCVIESTGAVTEAFGVSGFPTVIRVGDGIVRATGLSLDSVGVGGAVTAGVR